MEINPFIFREYDIRGVVEKDFPDDVVEVLGKAFGTFAQRKGVDKISLGGDVRLTTKRLKEAFTRGVISSAKTFPLGSTATPFAPSEYTPPIRRLQTCAGS